MRDSRPVRAEDRATGRVGLTGGRERLLLSGRLAAFVGVAVAAQFVAPALLYPVVGAASAVTGARLIAYGAMSCVAMLAATALALRWFGESWGDATGLGSTGLRGWRVVTGLASGWLAIAVPCGVLLWIGALRIEPAEPGGWWEAAAMAAVMLGPAALTEELAFRGYAFTLLRQMWGVGAAVLLTSTAFGLLHLLNPGASAQSITMVAVAGVFLAAVRLALGSLWAAWLAHFAYNFVQLALFHTPVSGLAVPQPHYRTVSSGPEWLTGGAWGPEAGAAAALGMMGVTFLLAVHARWVLIHRRGWRLDIDVRPIGRREP